MRHNHTLLYVHLVWATWDRLPIIEADWESDLYHEIRNEAHALQCHVYALNGMADHVHLLLQIPASIAISGVVKQLKGASAFFVNSTVRPNLHFKWQGNYSAFTVSRWDMKKVTGYIQRQKQHHAEGTTKAVLELPTFQKK